MVAQPPEPPRQTTWTLRQNISRVLWGSLGRLIWVFLPGLRSSLIRAFGGTVGPGCRFARTTLVYIPWHVHIGRDVRVGEKANIYSLGQITLGDGVVLDEKAHLCAGTHDMNDTEFPLLRSPITIGAGSFIGYDAFIAPGVTVGANCRVLPRASVYRDCPDDSVLRGNPAAPVPDNPEDASAEKSQ